MRSNAVILANRAIKIKVFNAKKFALWLFLISVCMLFAGLTSAYLVKKSDGNWLQFDMPQIFLYSTIVLIISILSMHWTYRSAKNNTLLSLKWGLLFTGLLAIIFSYLQFEGWGQLVETNVFLVGNPSGSFVYVFSGLHLVHLLGGLGFLVVVFVDTLKFQVHSKNLLTIEMCTTYWHFLGGLWIYLYLFLVINN
ncbi:MAG: cytochrome c oxidase subunit 3 [Flammeovirgaceae bacterium]|jgi:cytochrome c oxidase subunit III|nr:cytochrome c oxidase subunit 3 [Flammeovirgaceae bacterium]|tara:strand:- start:2011 stop:2595 length:585 start_codon:yes stop_codon:yes gene_type:complete